ncbi:MAG: hypothetical protein KC543_16765 [Myxococcales bacterium]|nr:hypothetical protein [Myxococcales bacterium]
MRARVRVCVTALGALLVVGCGSGSKSDGGETVAKYISRVTTQDGLTEGQLMAADAPDASGGPDLQVMAGMRVPNGGSLQAALTASAPARMVFVHVMDVPGHYALQLPADASSVNLLVTMAQKPPSKRFSIGYAVADASGKVGNTKFAEAELLDVGTGDVQVSLNMDVGTDLDLHVVDPNGFEIYYENETSPEGGTLDLDSNGGCDLDGKNNENVTWPAGAAPHGTYTVRVDNFENCGNGAVNWVVTVRTSEGLNETFRGSFPASDPGDGGGAGAGVPVTTFTFGVRP